MRRTSDRKKKRTRPTRERTVARAPSDGEGGAGTVSASPPPPLTTTEVAPPAPQTPNPPPPPPNEIDRAKLDPWLARALDAATNEEEPNLSVFVRMNEGTEEGRAEVLARIGADQPASATGAPLSALLSPRDVRAFSRNPAVAYMKLAQSRKPLGPR